MLGRGGRLATMPWQPQCKAGENEQGDIYGVMQEKLVRLPNICYKVLFYY
jgi:hypothetical protein